MEEKEKGETNGKGKGREETVEWVYSQWFIDKPIYVFPLTVELNECGLEGCQRKREIEWKNIKSIIYFYLSLLRSSGKQEL